MKTRKKCLIKKTFFVLLFNLLLVISEDIFAHLIISSTPVATKGETISPSNSHDPKLFEVVQVLMLVF